MDEKVTWEIRPSGDHYILVAIRPNHQGFTYLADIIGTYNGKIPLTDEAREQIKGIPMILGLVEAQAAEITRLNSIIECKQAALEEATTRMGEAVNHNAAVAREAQKERDAVIAASEVIIDFWDHHDDEIPGDPETSEMTQIAHLDTLEAKWDKLEKYFRATIKAKGKEPRKQFTPAPDSHLEADYETRVSGGEE